VSPIDRLGAALLHFLWQGTLIAAIYAAARAALRSAAPNARYLLACGALAAMAAAPAITWMVLAPPPAGAWTAAQTAQWAAARPYSPQAAISVYDSGPAPARYLPWVVAVWMAGAAGLSLRLAGGCVMAWRMRRRLVRPAPPEWQARLDRLRLRLDLPRAVRLLESAAVDVPTVAGWLRPVVLAPAAALSGMPPELLEGVLLHELAHIRRHDALVNLLQSLAETLLFYHPAVWWISGQIRAEREHCCDDRAVAATGDVLAYARALAAFESARRPGMAMAANGRPLAARIARLLGMPCAEPNPAPAAALAALLAAAALFAQAPAGRFEAASIKPGADQPMRYVRPMPGGRLVASAPVKMLLENAFAVQDFQIVGGPAWIDSDRYAIEAKAEGNPSREQLLRMLQPLLAERFRLEAHRETRQMPALALVPARHGAKLAPPKQGACAAPPPNAAPDWAGGRIAPPGGGPSPLPPCGSIRVSLAASGARLEGGAVAMPELIRVLSMVLDKPVLDRSGVAGTFDLRLDFLPDPNTPALPPPPPGSPAPDSNAASIVTALQEQLGLRLEMARGPVEVLVIDRIEHPTAN
jgi:uncharacterized protein (TIGR03435 family)